MVPTRSNSPSSYCSPLATVLTLVPSYNKTPDGRCYFLKMALQWVWSHVFFASWRRAYFSLFNLDGTLQYSTKRMGYVVPKAGSSKAVGFMPGSPPGLALRTQPSCCGEAQGFRVIASISHRTCGRRGTVNLLMSPALAFQPPQLIPHRADRVPTEH